MNNKSNIIIISELNKEEQQKYIFTSDRQFVDFVEIGTLSFLIIFGTLLNFLSFARLIRFSRSFPCKNSKALFGGPLYMNSFTLLKFNLAITDFAILLVHALGKLIWLLSYRWLFGDIGCRLYQFLSAFTYYSNSNVVVAIGIDRLKVVCSSQVQGNNGSSIRRVRLFMAIAWALAFICALPQIFFWTNFELRTGWSQCTTIWQIAEHHRSNNSTRPISRHWSLNKQTQLYYELLHQAGVFVIPFISLFASYFLIVLRVIRYTLKPNQLLANCNSYSSLIAPENWSGANDENLNCFPFWRKYSDDCRSPAPLAVVPEESVIGEEKGSAAPPPSPKAPISLSLFLFASSTLSGSSPNLRLQTKRNSSILSKLSRAASERHSRRKNAENLAASNNGLQRKAKRCSLNVPPTTENSLNKKQNLNLSSRVGGGRLSQPIFVNQLFDEKQQRNSLGKKSSMCSTSFCAPRAKTPLWRRQLRSKVFLRSLLIVAAHCAFWLPYNLLNLLRFSDESLYSTLVEKGALLVEDLIVMNAMLNPLLYGYGK
uniref:G_PROTEIN_RECEP_F1_2 domain-containing protein n=1 Tax=Meloidogyne hapla TaxID=6305 RepID=A0A1I8BLX1_MELHA